MGCLRSRGTSFIFSSQVGLDIHRESPGRVYLFYQQRGHYTAAIHRGGTMRKTGASLFLREREGPVEPTQWAWNDLL